ncbi:hypothetical protein DdX_04073 [Ditylenchus destructor]|uniref:Uncharacterized protein n=2 Tax=Ditylenchus destructor TaxID=166010 RepID=A0AAD4R5E8_9BILA|nr:hypothetical protein DdX_19324 [Ditylenchus destructor]KAI1723893.1 hypothetical protein DdX_04073 [Ditylenchus destructor]
MDFAIFEKMNKAELFAQLKLNIVEMTQIKAENENLRKSLEALTQTTADQSKAITNLTDTNAKVTVALINAQNDAKTKPQYGQPPILTNLSNVLTDAIAEGELRREKSKRAVIEKLPEKPDNEQTTAADKEFVKQIAHAIGIPDSEIDIDATHRHGMRNPNPAKHRPIKVHFYSTKVRNQFMYGFNSAIKSLTIQTNAFTRRDMTPTELKILYAQRQKAYEMNAECGQLKYYVVDLDLRERPNPKTLAKKNVTPDK